MKAFFRRKEMKRPPRLLAPIGCASTSSSFLFDAFFPSKLYSSFSFFFPIFAGHYLMNCCCFPLPPPPLDIMGLKSGGGYGGGGYKEQDKD